MELRKKIGFVFLDKIHHLFHFLTVAVELSKKSDVSIITYPGPHVFLRKELKRLGGERVKIEERPTRFFRAFTDKLKGRPIPRIGFWMDKNKTYLMKNFDALIFSAYIHHKIVKARKRSQFPKLIHIDHGAPGRAYSYSKDKLDFDLQLLFGEFSFQQFKKANLLSGQTKIVGYPKLDAVANLSAVRIFNNEKKTVWYAPHFTRKLTSWNAMGKEILDFFYNQNEYNLIFAPHIQLFGGRGSASENELETNFFDCPHIHIDLGSHRSVDMTYAKAADIYLGDVSSQVYEFIAQPKPCIFLNPYHFQYKNDINFRFWQCGEVVSSVSELENALRFVEENFQQYKPVQEKIMAENFYTEMGSNPSQRAANAVLDFLETGN